MKKPKRPRKVKTFYNILFYLVIISVLLGAFVYSRDSNDIKSFMGYSYFTVLTESMQSVIPKGSLVIVKRTEERNINIGDDITFLENSNRTITHRVVNIFEDYDHTGARGFQTKGVDNINVDENIVYASNVIGVVKFHAKGVGKALSLIRENTIFIFVVFAIMMILSFCIRIFFEIKREESQEKCAKAYK